MKPKKICKGCEEAFAPKRSNQLYHNATCRNKYNMIAFRNREAGLYKLLKRIYKTDETLSQLYHKNAPQVYIVDEIDFKKLGIFKSNSRFLKIVGNELEEMRFFNFKLLKISKGKYEITRNELNTFRKL
jgi:hypothetical protein